MAISIPRKLISVDEYERMIEEGVLTKYDRVELIRGEIREKMPINPPHAGCVIELTSIFYDLLGKTVVVSVQSPVRLPNGSMPEPDVALLKRQGEAYHRRRPTVEDIILLIEVADSTLKSDREEKMPLYAEVGVPDYWIANLVDGVIEVYSNPVGGTYQRVHIARRGESVVLPGGLPGAVSVDEVLGS